MQLNSVGHSYSMKTFHSEYNDFMHIEEVIGKNLKHYRAQAEITQHRVAEICGVSDQQIRDIEAGRKKPSIDLLVRIASALKVESSHLLEHGEPIKTERPLPFKTVLGMYSNIPEEVVKRAKDHGPDSPVWGFIMTAFDEVEAHQAKKNGNEAKKNQA